MDGIQCFIARIRHRLPSGSDLVQHRERVTDSPDVGGARAPDGVEHRDIRIAELEAPYAAVPVYDRAGGADGIDVVGREAVDRGKVLIQPRRCGDSSDRRAVRVSDVRAVADDPDV